MKRYIRINTLNYIFILVVFSLFIPIHLFSDIGSVSPTINRNIYPTEWKLAGLEGGDLSDDYPVIAGTIFVDDPAEIQDEIDAASSYPGTWRVMLQPGTYVLNSTINMKSNVILSGPYQYKKSKDESDRAIIQFDIIDYGGVSGYNRNCIEFKGTDQVQLENAGVEDIYIKRIDTVGNPGGTQAGNNIYMVNCNNCFVSGV